LIDRLITVDPKKRATLSEVLSHPWVNKDYSAPPPSYIPARRAITQNELSSDIIARLQIFGYKVADINAAFTEQDLTKPNPIRATYHLLSEMVARERAKAITEQRRMLSQMTISESPIGKSENAQIASSLSTIPNTVQDHRIISSPGDTTKQNLDIMANQRADFAKMSSRRQSAPFVNMAPAPSNRRVSLKDDIKTFASKWLLGNTTATGSLPQKVEVYQITDILDEFHIRYKKESEFTLICETEADVNLSKPGQIVMFQIDLKSGVNFKRIAGGVWNYKKICNKIQNKVKDQ
jgi:serine/threonine protein kinase